MWRRSALILVCLVSGVLRPVQAHSPADLEARGSEAYAAGDFTAAGALFLEALDAGWGTERTAYNAACCLALAGDRPAAFDALQTTVRMGFSHVEQLTSDRDLESLRDDPRWEQVIQACRANAARQERHWDNPVWRTEYRPDLPMVEKIAGLSRAWAGAQYGFANFDLVPDLDWDAAYFTALEEVLATRSTREYYDALRRLFVQLQDGHTYVTPPAELRSQVWSRPLVRTRLVEGRVLVVDTYGDTSERHGIHVGDEVIEVDGLAVQEYSLRFVRPVQFASTPQDLDTKAYDTRLLSGAEGSQVHLLLERPDGSRYDCTLERLWGSARSDVIPETPSLEVQRVGPQGAFVHVRLNTFNKNETAEQFEARFDELAQARGMILDVRENGGGNSSVGWRVLKLLTAQSFPSSSWFTPQYRPAFRAWRRPQVPYSQSAQVVAADGDRVYEGPVVVLTSPRTYSAAEDFCVSFRSMQRGRIIGEATGGSTGQPLRLQLPGGLAVAVCSKRDRFPDGTDFVGVGIRPDHVVTPTVADLRGGRDTVLDAAIDELTRATRE